MLIQEYYTNTFIQHSLSSLCIHCYSLLFSWAVRYLNRKSNEYSTHIFLQYYLSICLFTLTVRYSVVQFVIQIIKIVNKGLIYIYSFLWSLSIHSYGSLFNWPVRYLNRVE